MARQGAAGVLQSAWRRIASRLRLLEQRHREHRQKQDHHHHRHGHESIPAPVERVGGGDTASLAASSMTPTAGEEHKSSAKSPRLIPRHLQLLEGAEAHGAVYAVCGAFTSLLTAAATREVVRRVVDQALLAPAAATLATFNHTCRKVVTTAAPQSPSAPPPALPSRIRTTVSPDPASFDCAPSFKRDMDLAVRRMAGALRARASSLSAVRAAAGRLVGGGTGGWSGEDPEGAATGTEAFETEAASLVSAVSEVCIILCLRSRSVLFRRPCFIARTFMEATTLTLGCRYRVSGWAYRGEQAYSVS